MTSIYLVRCDDGWLYVDGESSGFRPSRTGAMVYGDRRTAAQTAAMLQAVPVEFREVPKDAAAIAVVRHVGRAAPLPLDDDGDTAAGALAAAEATIARLRDELEQLRNRPRPSTHELAKRFLESTDG